jgi:hypothetical protein
VSMWSSKNRKLLWEPFYGSVKPPGGERAAADGLAGRGRMQAAPP